MNGKRRGNNYLKFLQGKAQACNNHGFKPLWLSDKMFDFQHYLAEWMIRKGRGATFADCGTGKTILQLVWAENIARKTNKRVLILTPLAVGPQTVKEGEKFGIECQQSRDGKLPRGVKIVVTNYERLHYFNQKDFIGCVADESSCLKNFDGVTKAKVTEFMRTLAYRSFYTATAAPNDYIELGTSSEALGELGFIDMLNRFFKKNQSSKAKQLCRGSEYSREMWRFRGHAEKDFWRWVCSWSRAMRYPSDLGFDDGPFILPELRSVEHVVKSKTESHLAEGFLFSMPAIGLKEQRRERRNTINERCEKAAELAASASGPVVSWCHLNDEGDLLTQLIPNAVQVAGKDSLEYKEEMLTAFTTGEISALVTKPKIAGFGLNWQHCWTQTFFPSHSFEQWYQAIRRSWRFGQEHPVTVHMISSEGEKDILLNLQRKQKAAEVVYEQIVNLMGNELRVNVNKFQGEKERMPSWL